MRSNEPDFAHRVPPSQLPEWLDEPRPLDEMRLYMKSLRQVNTVTFGARPTLSWLAPFTAGGGLLRIIDIGCGCGDMLRRIERWAHRHSLNVQLTGIDLSAGTVEIAREFTSPHSSIQWIVGDALSYTQPFDIAISALLTHHLEEPMIVRFLSWMEENAQRAWFINDLVREPMPYRIFGKVGRLLRWHPQVRHDGPISFRRAFREEDWRRMVSAAHIPALQVELRRWTPGRLCVGRVKQG
jgi:SAM-dependent methyltransferase